MLLFFVPSSSAICSCVSPAALRSAIICRFISNAGASASYSAFTSGRLRAFFRNCSKVRLIIVLYLLHAFLCRFHLAWRYLVAFLDHGDQHDDFPALESAENRTRDTFPTFGADLKQP